MPSAALALLDGTETLTIGDSGNDTTVIIKGTLQVDGTTTTINSTTLDIDDLNDFSFCENIFLENPNKYL